MKFRTFYLILLILILALLARPSAIWGESKRMWQARDRVLRVMVVVIVAYLLYGLYGLYLRGPDTWTA